LLQNLGKIKGKRAIERIRPRKGIAQKTDNEVPFNSRDVKSLLGMCPISEANKGRKNPVIMRNKGKSNKTFFIDI
jgi:hypothetical protein